MPRLSIEISPQDHQQLKAMAALKGLSIKDYVLSRALVEMPDPASMSDAEALTALKKLLTPRLSEASSGQIVTGSTADIKNEARARRSGK